MKPDWDLLSEHFEEERSVFIADVNCQVEESLCSDYHTGGTYPTILVFPRGKDERPHAELYQGGRGFDDLRKFVDQRLVLPCDIRNDQETCSAKAQVYISKWRAKDRQAQHAELVRLRSMANEMTYELSKWVSDRIQILHQLVKQEESEL